MTTPAAPAGVTPTELEHLVAYSRALWPSLAQVADRDAQHAADLLEQYADDLRMVINRWRGPHAPRRVWVELPPHQEVVS